MIRDILSEEIKRALEALGLGIEPEEIVLDHPSDLSFGDYSTNVAMILAKRSDQNPRDLAEKIKGKILLARNERIKDVQVAGPGFINFYLSEKFFFDNLSEILKKGDTYGQNKNLASQKVLVEYTDPNPFKVFHIGHLMSNSIGEALSRIIEKSSADTKRLTYGGDVGLHVAKAIWGVLLQKEKIEEIREKDEKTQLKFWSDSYVLGSSKYEDDAVAKKEIDDLNKIIFDKTDQKINEIYDWGRGVSIRSFQEIFTRLGSKFDQNFWESEVSESGLRAVEEGLKKNILEKSDGAVIFRGENYGLHTRVFVNSRGVPTYEAKDLGLGLKKMELFDFDRSIIITGNEQNDYFKVMFKVLDLLRPEVANKTKHIGHGMLRFSSGKMSSRKGNVISGIDLIEQVKEKVIEKISSREFSGNERENIAEAVAIGALKYSILKQSPGRDIVFDFDKSLSFEGDSGPYLQYAYARAQSVLTKAEKIFEISANSRAEISAVERILYQFPEIVERAYSELAPQHIATYLISLASTFNSYYAQNKIIGSENEVYRLGLTKAVAQVLKSGLNLLGIPILEKM